MSRKQDVTKCLPIHGFVLAGGKSSRMGLDKALLPFRGRPMVEVAVSKLGSFCSEVSIAGNRDDLAPFAPVVHESRVDVGPVAGIEAGLMACRRPWAMFVPVDVPLISPAFLRRWAEAVLQEAEAGCGLSTLSLEGEEQPAFCMLRRECAPFVKETVSRGERRIRSLLTGLEQHGGEGSMWMADVREVAGDLLHLDFPGTQLRSWFTNLNTPKDLLFAETGFGPE